MKLRNNKHLLYLVCTTIVFLLIGFFIGKRYVALIDRDILNLALSQPGSLSPDAKPSSVRNSGFLDSISGIYENGYSLKTINVDDKTVALVSPTYESNTPGGDGLDISSDDNTRLYVLRGNIILQEYEIKMFTTYAPNLQFRSVNIDKEGENEIFTEWESTAGGSGGTRGFVVWKLDINGKLTPDFGLPDEFKGKNKDNDLNIEDANSGKKWSIPVTSSNNFVRYEFAPIFRVNVASFIWNFDKGESHFDPHIWVLSRYVLLDHKLVIDSTWNKGGKYTTKEKIGFGESEFEKISNLFSSVK